MNEKKNGSITISNYSAFKSLCIFLLLCLSLSGCTLARPELQQTEEEELCGILVVVGEQEAEREQEKALEGKSFSGIRELEKALLWQRGLIRRTALLPLREWKDICWA